MALYGIDKKWEIDPESLTIGERIGRGVFGYVYKGKHKEFGDVAIKTLQNAQSNHEKKEFFDTIKIWVDVDHPNIVKLYGICSQVDGKQLIISEFMKYTSLDQYIRHEIFLKESCSPSQVCITIALHICKGMKYLASNNLVVRYLDFENILVNHDGIVKIYRVWLSKKLVNGIYSDPHYTKVAPSAVDYFPPEVRSRGMFSVKSDVYSFGLFLVELASHLREWLSEANVLEKLFSIITACKKEDPQQRPSFEEIEKRLTTLFNDYIKLDDEAVYNEAYYHALKKGKVTNNRIPIMIVGQDRAGKTSLRKHLQGLSFDEGEPSTCGIEVDMVEISDKSVEEPWGRKESLSFIIDQEKVTEEVVKQAALFVHSKSNQGEESGELAMKELEEKTSRLDIASEERRPIETLPKDTIDSIISHEKSIDEEPSTKVIGLLHDLAGQCIFYDTHYCFLKSKCPYIVVHDLRNPLESPAQPRFKPKAINIERNLNNPLLATNLEYFLSWLNVLNKLRDSYTATCSNDTPPCGFQLPPVLIALTNSDRLVGDVNEVKQKIKDIVKEKAFDNVFIEIYVVDNTASGNFVDDVKKLRRKIYDLCRSLLKMQRPIPISWFQLEAELSKKLFDEKRNHISLNEVFELGKTCKVEDVQSALRFLHHHGVVVHHEQSPIVVINPVWLMNLFTQVITIPEYKPADALHCKHFSEGILMKSYLRQKNHGEILEDLMIQYGLICPCRVDDADAFIVPSVAPLMEKGEDVQKQLSESPIMPLFFIFPAGYILPGIFTRFLVKLINEYQGYLRNKKPRLYSNYTLLSLRWNKVDVDVYVIQELSRIKIGVVPRSKTTHGDHVKVASFLMKTMLNCLQKIKDEKSFLRSNIHSFVAVKCPVCCGKVSPCTRHNEENCTNDDCGHYWSLEELEESKDDPICRFGSVVQCAVFPLTRVTPWLGIDEDTFPQHEMLINDLAISKRQDICRKLDVLQDVGHDYRHLADHLGMKNDDLALIGQKNYPTDQVLKWAETKNVTIRDLRESLLKMEREDCLAILDDST